ncbi:MAG: ATP-binding protein [Acidobacteriota bacterium]|nr:ATP-binding protein [Acidobacteriota bacterium]
MPYAPSEIPLRPGPTDAGGPPPADRPDRSILIVDDEESIRWLFAECLGARYYCTTAANAEEALAALARESFAIVLADVSMPGLSGVELLRRIVAQYPDTAVIMISGIDRTQRVLDAVRIGAFDYLIKPIDLDVLELSVERALERRDLLNDARRYKQDLERRNSELARRKTELERLQAQIVHSEKMASLGQLAAGVAHELNNPAGFIYGNMDFLGEAVEAIERLLTLYDSANLSEATRAQVAALKGEIDYENTLSDLRSIIMDCREGAERIKSVVQNLRTFSRLDEAEFKQVDIHEGIDSTVRLLSRYYSGGRIRLVREYGELPVVDCYAGQLNQVWMNLLANAAQAVEQAGGGEVTIQTYVERETVMVAVSDTGIGIAPEHLRKIFDPFFTTKPVGEGTGLGLSVTYSIVERHGGFIRVRSRPGQGTTFVVGLPTAGKGLK